MAAFRSAVTAAEASGEEVARTLELVIDEVQPERLWLLANNMGAQVVADAFGLLYEEAELIEPDSDFIALVDVTPVNRTINFHNFYLESPKVYDDLFQRLVNPGTPHRWPLYPIQNVDGSVYWVLTRGR